MKTILIATLGGSYKTVVNAVIQHNPEFLWIVCTPQSENKISDIEAELKKQAIPMPPLLGKTLVIHDDLSHIFKQVKHLLNQLNKDYVVTFDLTGGTVPMSLGAWEASSYFTDVIISWVDNTEPPKTHILNRPT